MALNEQIPHDKSLDNSLALMQEGYLFISNRVSKYHSDIFEARLLGQRVICMSGKEAAEIFYDPDKFKRQGAVPKRVQKTLFGENGVQTLDGHEHRHRKQLFMTLMTTDMQKELGNLTMQGWLTAISKWQAADKVVLFEEAKDLLCSVACQWAGVPLKKSEVKEKADDFIAMIYAFGRVGPEHWKGRRARTRLEGWIKGLIEDVRAGKLDVADDTALAKIAFYKQQNGTELSLQIAAVELLNVIRPIVAIATFITFTALAIHDHPEHKNFLFPGNDTFIEMFTQEVRRYYPFGPFVGARVRKDFSWKNCKFQEDMLVLLDMYGTNHDKRLWENPNQFNPYRFQDWKGDLYKFIPQGGGDPSQGHRCPSEGITVEIMKVTLDFLVNKITFDVPNQDLNYSLQELPTLPKSGFEMTNIRKK